MDVNKINNKTSNIKKIKVIIDMWLDNNNCVLKTFDYIDNYEYLLKYYNIQKFFCTSSNNESYFNFINMNEIIKIEKIDENNNTIYIKNEKNDYIIDE